MRQTINVKTGKVILQMSADQISTCVALSPVQSEIAAVTPHCCVPNGDIVVQTLLVTLIVCRHRFAPAYAQKKAVSNENGYQTWGGGMKNHLVFHTTNNVK